MENQKLPLSVVIVAKNEELNIEDCIKSADFAEEIIVIDDFSSDKTKEIAEKLGAKVFQRAMNTNFSAQVNFGISKTSQPWLFILDADERITPELQNSIAEAVEKNEPMAFEVKRRNLFRHFKAQHGTVRSDSVVRLFPNKDVKYEGEVHPSITHPYPTGSLKGLLDHYTYRSWDHYYHKLNLYGKLSAEKYIHQGKKPSFIRDIVFRPAWAAFKVYVFNGGFLDGKMGFVLAANHYSYTLQKYVRFWTKSQTKDDLL